jgi:hypothetical protein
MRSLLLALAVAGFTAIVSAQAQVPNFNDCSKEAGSRALTQDQRREFMRACMARIRATCAQQVRQRQVHGDAGRDLMRACQGMPPRRR